MDDIHPRSPEDPTPASGAAAPSDRLRLEVELLAAAESPPATDDAAPPGARRTVLVALAEPELGTYVRRCLRAYRRLRVAEPGAGEHALAAARRLSPVLLIAEPGTVGVPPPALPVPLLLLVEELREGPPARHPEAAALVFLAQPFNARRLLAAVEPLLGPPDAAKAGPGSDPQPQ